eukprot:1193080-Prorocentrum_minimum.AAC.8
MAALRPWRGGGGRERRESRIPQAASTARSPSTSASSCTAGPGTGTACSSPAGIRGTTNRQTSVGAVVQLAFAGPQTGDIPTRCSHRHSVTRSRCRSRTASVTIWGELNSPVAGRRNRGLMSA